MANRTTFKKMIATLLTVVMVLNGISVFASAAATTPELVENFADTYYKQDGTAGSANDWEIHLSKTAYPTNTDNLYDITLQIQTKDTSMQLSGATHGAVTLVLDVSNSMNKTVQKKSQTTHLDNLKNAVSDFLDEYVKDAKSGDKRLVSIAVFGTNAVTIQKWINVNSKLNLAQVKTLVNSLRTGNGAYLGKEYLCNGGTNMEAGLVLGRNLLNQSTDLAGIPTANQSLILFSDGAPTAAVGNVNNKSVKSVSYNGGDSGYSTDKEDYNDISRILSGVAATKIAVKYGYTDTQKVLATPPFTRVITTSADTLSVDLVGEAGKVITSLTTASTVTDPMGTGITMVSGSNGYDAAAEAWDLTQFTPSVVNGVTTYTIHYQVEIDPEAVPADANFPAYTILTPANGATALNYTFGEAATPVSADFNEPNVRGIRSFTVSYEYTGAVPAGAPTVPAAAEYKAGAAVVVAAAPALENYTFIGWDKADFTMPAEDVVIRGFWTENPKYDYALTYNANFGENETKADSENVTDTYATARNIIVDQNTFVRENYTFAGWNTEADGTGKAYTAGEAVALTAENNTEILYAQWDEHDKYSYSLVYNANFGVGETKADSENVTGVYDVAYDITVDENTFVREHYTFDGWNTEADGSGDDYAATDIVNLTAENNTEILYAQWVEDAKYDYALTYNANFGENEEKADGENVTGVYDTAYGITVDENTFVREHYYFDGWNTEADGSGDDYAATDIVNLTAENNTEILYAQWVEEPKFDYSLIYNANFGENEEKADSENVTGVYDLFYNIIVDENTFVRENFTFVGWNTAADGSGDDYAVDSAVELNTDRTTAVLYAQWIENEKYDYSVIYNANFGENEEKADGENVTGVYDELYNIAVDENTFVRENYTFAGWNTEADGTGTAYETDALVVLTAEENIEILYAQWIENEQPPVEPPVDPPVESEPEEEPPVDPPVESEPEEEPPVDPPVESEPEEEIEIPDDPVPLNEAPTPAPKTGVAASLFPIIAFIAGAGALIMAMRKKREEN